MSGSSAAVHCKGAHAFVPVGPDDAAVLGAPGDTCALTANEHIPQLVAPTALAPPHLLAHMFPATQREFSRLALETTGTSARLCVVSRCLT